MNAERILIAAECIGDGRWFIEKATAYASERVVFGRPIGANQGVQFPIAQAHARDRGGGPDALQGRVALRRRASPAAPRRTWRSCLAAEASWQAANACLDAHGGFGFAEEYDVERKFRETRLYKVAPDLEQPHSRLRRPARPRHAPELLASRRSRRAADAQKARRAR